MKNVVKKDVENLINITSEIFKEYKEILNIENSKINTKKINMLVLLENDVLDKIFQEKDMDFDMLHLEIRNAMLCNLFSSEEKKEELEIIEERIINKCQKRGFIKPNVEVIFDEDVEINDEITEFVNEVINKRMNEAKIVEQIQLEFNNNLLVELNNQISKEKKPAIKKALLSYVMEEIFTNESLELDVLMTDFNVKNLINLNPYNLLPDGVEITDGFYSEDYQWLRFDFVEQQLQSIAEQIKEIESFEKKHNDYDEFDDKVRNIIVKSSYKSYKKLLTKEQKEQLKEDKVTKKSIKYIKNKIK